MWLTPKFSLSTSGLFRIALFSLFIGFFWKLLLFPTTYRELLYNYHFLTPICHILEVDIVSLFKNQNYSRFITILSQITAIPFFLSSILVLRLKKENSNKYLVRSTLLILFIELTTCLFHKFFLVLLIEHFTFIFTPLLFYYFIKYPNKIPQLITAAKYTIAFTFIGHGIFAIGLLPQPGYFIDMIIAGINVSEVTARNILYVMGVLDFIFAILIILSTTGLNNHLWWNKVFKINLIYGILWASLTTIARIWSFYYDGLFLMSIFQQFYKFAIRIPHIILPVIIYRHNYLKKKE